MGGTAIEGAGTLLTGASSGIGRATALELAGRGARLAVVARRGDRLEALAEEIVALGCNRPAVLVADLAVTGVAHDVAAQARSALGDIDILVNNAGGGVGGQRPRLSELLTQPPRACGAATRSRRGCSRRAGRAR